MTTVAPGVHPNQARKERVTLALGNPVFFGEFYMRPYDAVWREVGPLPMVCHEMLAFAAQAKRGVIITPPEWLKTTTISQLYPLWRTFEHTALGKPITGMLLSEGAGLAEKNMSVVRWHIEHNERLASDFRDKTGAPLVRPSEDEQKWNESEITIQRLGTSKDPTWQARGLDSIDPQGSRLTYLIGDDVTTPRTANSPTMQEKSLRLWDTQFTMRVLDHGQAIVAGNYNHPRDMLSSLAGRPAYAVLKRPALHVPGDPSKAPDDPTDPDAIESLPEKWPRRRLEEARHEKPNRFRRIFLLDSRAEQGERLKVEWVTLISAEETPRDCVYVMAVDPAPGGEGDDDDFFNVTVGALHREHLDLIVSHDMRGTTTDQVELVSAYYDQFANRDGGVRAIGGAKVSLDRYFRGALAIHREDIGRKLVEVSIPGSKTDRITEERLEGLGPYAKNSYLRIRETAWVELTSAPEDRHQELSLSEQWRDFPAIPHDDKLDGADVLVRTALEHGGRGRKRKVKVGTSR